MGKKEVKTNAMRILDRKKISYEYQTYECDEFTLLNSLLLHNLSSYLQAT